MRALLCLLLLLPVAGAAQPLTQGERNRAMSELHATRKQFLDAIEGLTPAQWNFKPAGGGWSVAETAEHIAVSEDELGKAQILRHAPIRNYYYARNVIAVARLAHVSPVWRIRSLAALGAQIGLIALKGAPGGLTPIWAGLRDGFAGRLGPAPPRAAWTRLGS